MEKSTVMKNIASNYYHCYDVYDWHLKEFQYFIQTSHPRKAPIFRKLAQILSTKSEKEKFFCIVDLFIYLSIYTLFYVNFYNKSIKNIVIYTTHYIQVPIQMKKTEKENAT